MSFTTQENWVQNDRELLSVKTVVLGIDSYCARVHILHVLLCIIDQAFINSLINPFVKFRLILFFYFVPRLLLFVKNGTSATR